MGPRGGVQKLKYYAVRRGRNVGVYTNWAECEEAVKGYSGAQYKSFGSVEEANQFISGGPAPGCQQQQDTYHHAPSAPCTTYSSFASRDTYIPTAPAPKPTYQPPASASYAMQQAPTSSYSQQPQHVIQSVREAAQQQVARLQRSGVINSQQEYCVNFDGASRGNPGRAGAGAVITDRASGREVAALTHPLPYGCTNNEAEYAGLLLGLHAATLMGAHRLTVQGDSQLVCRQIMGQYRVNKEHLVPYHSEAKGLISRYFNQPGSFILQHVERAANSRADELSNVAADAAPSR